VEDVEMKTAFVSVTLTVAALLLAITSPTLAQDCSGTTDLLAGQYTDAGDVIITSDSENLYVQYVTADGWCLTETHLQVSTDPNAIPQKKGNPAPGKFEYKRKYDCVTEDTYVIALPEDWQGTTVYVAAHAVVRNIVGYEDPNLEEFNDTLPDTATITVTYPGTAFGSPSYFDTTVTNGGILDGIYDGYCIDTDRTISANTSYDVQVFSSYDADLASLGLVEFPENLDLVNYILNRNYIGQPSVAGGNFTYGDIQRAIWALIEDAQSTSGLGSWSQARVDEILADALGNGEGFTPGCDQVVAVILNPVNATGGTSGQITIAQVTFVEAGVPCDPVFQYETAWGSGADFSGANWAMYTCYTVPAPEPIKIAGSRFRSFGNTGAGEVYLGVGDLGVGANRVEKQVAWAKPGSYDVTFTYDPGTQTLVTSSSFGSLTYNLPGPLDYMDSFEVIVADRDTGCTVNFTNVIVNGVSLGDFVGNDAFAAYKFSTSDLGVDLNGGFTFTGTIYIDGPFGTSQELSRVEILCGRYIY
jgi:hypothetical protein